MSEAPFTVTQLERPHNRSSFCCGTEQLDQYLKQQARQDIKRRVAACYVALSEDSTIAGYYTLSSASVPLSGLPVEIRKQLPYYPNVPVVRMGRLAVDQTFKGKGLGGALLADALERAERSEIAVYAMLVEAKDDQAAAFYQHYGFIALPETPLVLFLPMESVFPGRKKSRSKPAEKSLVYLVGPGGKWKHPL